MSLRLALALSLAACTTSPPPPTDVATGAVGAWQTAAPLPTARANHCSAAIDDWILVIGGNRSVNGTFVKTDEIHAAQLGPDGAVGPWQLAGHTSSPVSECNATSDGRHLYIIDGLYDTATDNGKIWTADLDATGHLGGVMALGALPEGVIAISSEATIHAGTLLLMDTRLPAEGDTTVTLRTPLAGAVTWSTDDWKIGFRARAQYAFTDRFAYTIGGYQDTTVGATADVFAAPIGATGAIGAAIPQAALPAPVAFGRAVAADSWIFLAGGRAQVFGAPGTTAVYAAPLATDGSVGAWQTVTALPMGRTNHSLALVGDYLVLTGGALNGPGDTTVLVAQVRYPTP